MLALRARERGIDLVRRVADGLPDIVADKRAVNQILLNLLSNAIRFTDSSGKVTVSAHGDGAEMVFVVEDTGVGISADDLARIGEPFFQARASYDRRHDGTGLGLSIVKGLVRLHGGDINIRSRLGEGTRVTVRLPLDCERVRLGKSAPVAIAMPAPAPTPLNVREGQQLQFDMPVKKRA
jgi:cell cycle sensor histidine kinase DivJ